MTASKTSFWPLVLSAVLLTSFASHAHANRTVYTCKGPDGKISLQQGPCHGDAQQKMQTVRNAPSLNADVRKPTTAPARTKP